MSALEPPGDPSRRARANTIIAGVNKAGTTSLFVSLSGHPAVAPASVKETRYFLPTRYGRTLEPVSVYEDYFRDASERPIRLEATPSYFYGGEPLVAAMHELLGRPQIVIVLREPVSRLVSFFTYQKARLRLPAEMTLAEYVAAADRHSADDFRNPDNEAWFGFRGGCYADYLPAWLDERTVDLRVVFFDDLISRPSDVLVDLAEWLRIDPGAFPRAELSSENRTTGFRNRGFQRAALAFNDRFERFLRRHHGLKERLRSAYYRVNGQSARERVPDELRAELAERYSEPNSRLLAQLRGTSVVAPGGVPSWLDRQPASAPVAEDG